MDPLQIGHVLRVEGDSVGVRVAIPELSINYHGKEYRVGRIGSYVTIPLGRRTIIGYITGCSADDGDPDQDLSHPTHVEIYAQLLGTVTGDRFRRGVSEYPTVGDPVRLGVDEDFELIFGSFDELAEGDNYAKSFSMGRFAVDTDFEVKVLGKEFFAKHIAVMGNSGSGKSVSTAKILHEATQLPHSHVIMFDMHGEYLRAFSDDYGNPLPNVTYLSDRNLVLPYWMLAYEEFEQIFVDRGDPRLVGAQQIFLRQGFERLKYEAAEALGMRWEYTIDTPVFYDVDQLLTYARNMNEARFVTNTDTYAFARLPYRQRPRAEQEQLLLTRRMEFNPAESEGETPHATYFSKLLGFINGLESKLNDRRYDFLLKPFEQARRNMDLAGRIDSESAPAEKSQMMSLVLRQLLGMLDERKNLTIIDLSGLPFDVVDTTIAVLTRALFDFNFWSPPAVRQPILICFEEAHNYLPRKPIEGRKTFARHAVEKVAKEGRKYGVAAMIVSQRPSEISETVLSQCSSMVLLRMNNPDDQEYAARVVSDQFRSLISLLPSMRPGEGFIIGDAVLMPMRTLIDMPPKEPQSANLDFFRLWSVADETPDVEGILDRWWRQDRAQKIDETAKGPRQAAQASDAPGDSNDAKPCDEQPHESEPQDAGEPHFVERPNDELIDMEIGDPPADMEAVNGAPSNGAGEVNPNARSKLAALAALLGRKKE